MAIGWYYPKDKPAGYAKPPKKNIFPRPLLEHEMKPIPLKKEVIQDTFNHEVLDDKCFLVKPEFTFLEPGAKDKNESMEAKALQREMDEDWLCLIKIPPGVPKGKHLQFQWHISVPLRFSFLLHLVLTYSNCKLKLNSDVS